MSQTIPISKIKLDAGTQQRPIDPDVLAEYVALMKDGTKFPPINLMFDGEHYYITDGFHRVETLRTLKKKDVQANVAKGTQTEAIWMSYAANKSHGLPRQKGVVKRIIESILCNPEWSKRPQTDIAKHVGVTRGYVSQIKSSLSAEQKKGVTTNTLLRADTVVVKSKSGKEYEQPVQKTDATPSEEPTEKERATSPKKSKATEPVPKDADGLPIPEHLRERFEQAAELLSYANVLSKLKGEISSIAKDHAMAWGFYNLNGFRADITQMAAGLRLSAPYICCPYCGGEDSDKCIGCKGLGFLSKAQARCVPVEMRPKKK